MDAGASKSMLYGDKITNAAYFGNYNVRCDTAGLL